METIQLGKTFQIWLKGNDALFRWFLATKVSLKHIYMLADTMWGVSVVITENKNILYCKSCRNHAFDANFLSLTEE